MCDKKNKEKVIPSEMRCNECGKIFKKKITKNTFEVQCPKCGGYDTEPTEFFGR